MSEPTKEQVEQLQKDKEALEGKIKELEAKVDKGEGDGGGNADAAKARKMIDDLKKANDDLAKKVKEHEDEKAEAEKAKLSEVERLKKEKEEAEGKAKTAEETLAKAIKENAFGYAAMQAGCSNVQDAIKLADLSDFNPEDAEASKAFVEEFKKGKPYLFGEKGMARVGTDGKEPNPDAEKKDQETQQKLKEASEKGDSLAALKAIKK